MTTINHWGKWVDSDTPVTGVLSHNQIAWEWMPEYDICLTCEEIEREMQAYEADEEELPLEGWHDSDHTVLLGDWRKDGKGLYEPDPAGEFAAIQRETTVQVMWSKYTTRGALCSPCYPGQVDIGSTGEFLGYTLPPELLVKDEE